MKIVAVNDNQTKKEFLEVVNTIYTDDKNSYTIDK